MLEYTLTPNMYNLTRGSPDKIRLSCRTRGSDAQVVVASESTAGEEVLVCRLIIWFMV